MTTKAPPTIGGMKRTELACSLSALLLLGLGVAVMTWSTFFTLFEVHAAFGFLAMLALTFTTFVATVWSFRTHSSERWLRWVHLFACLILLYATFSICGADMSPWRCH